MPIVTLGGVTVIALPRPPQKTRLLLELAQHLLVEGGVSPSQWGEERHHHLLWKLL